jgi:hypothetical protein
MTGNFLAMSVKSEIFCPAPPTLSVSLVGYLELLGVYKRATGPQGYALYDSRAG